MEEQKRAEDAAAQAQAVQEQERAAEAEEDEDEDEDTVDEATEMHEVPSSAGHKLQSKQNKVGNVRASGGKATGNLKKVSNGAGQDLPDSAGHKLTSKKNVVAGKAGKAGDLFA